MCVHRRQDGKRRPQQVAEDKFHTFGEKELEMAGPTVTNDPKRAFGLQDKLLAIYRKDCCINVPFLNLNYLDTQFLLDPTNSQFQYDCERTLSQLCPDHRVRTV